MGTGTAEPQPRARWERIDWSRPSPAEVFPEAHWLDLGPLALAPATRAALVRLFACFTCELFVHFEAYVIRYLQGEAARIPGVPQAALARFVAEERVHTEAFERLLARLRPDLYPSRAPRFLRWSRSDDAALALAPLGTFFLLAWLFEEITLFVPQALDRAPGRCDPVVEDVMRLHAREEAPHVAIDARVLERLAERPAWVSAAEGALTLPLLVYVDGKVRAAWRALVAHASAELELTAAQRTRLERRGPTQSDRWGMRSFEEKLRSRRVPGTALLRLALRRELARAGDAPAS